MKSDMTSRERMLAAIGGKPVDHIPLGQIFHSTVMGTPPDLQWKNQFERSKVMKDLGFDPVIDIWMPDPAIPPEGITVRQWKETDPDGPDPLLCAEYTTPAGPLTVKVRQTPDWYHFTHYLFLPTWDGDSHRPRDRFDNIELMDDWFTRRYKVPLISGKQDLDKMRYLFKAPTGRRRDDWLEGARKAMAHAKDMDLLTQARSVSVGDWFMWVCLIEEFCCAMVEEPEYVAEFYDVVQEYNREIIDLVIEVQPDLIQYRGWYDTPDYWGRIRHKKILEPRIQELAKLVHDGGSKFCYLLPEGYTLYRDMLAEMDVDVFLGLEPLAARKSEDFKLVKEAFRDKHCIWGGVNAPVTVGMGSDDEIDQATRYAIETLGPTGFILNAAIYIYDDDVTWDRFMKFVECWRNYS